MSTHPLRARSPHARRAAARSLVALTGTALLVPLAAVPADARPELPAVAPGDLAYADQVAVDAEATLAAAVAAEDQATAHRDASAAAVDAATAALADVDAQLADLAEALRQGEQRRDAATERFAAATVATRATTAARGLEPMVIAGAGAGAAGFVGLLGRAVAMEPLAAGVEEHLDSSRTEVAEAAQEVHRLRGARAALLGDRWSADGDLMVARQAHQAAVVEADRAAAASRSTRGATTVAATQAEDLLASIAVDTRLVRPGTGAISSDFGTRRHPVTGVVKAHTGTDFQVGDGVAYAAAAGSVVSVGHDTAYGLLVVVAHGTVDGAAVTTGYAHLARADVVPGQEVAPGQPLGTIGSTGLSTGPHLHFEIRLADTPVDPVSWLGVV